MSYPLTKKNLVLLLLLLFSCLPCVADIVCWNGTIVVLTENQQLLYKSSSDKSFKNLSTPKPHINSISMGPDNLLWIVDEKNLIYFSDNYFEDNSLWWQVFRTFNFFF